MLKVINYTSYSVISSLEYDIVLYIKIFSIILYRMNSLTDDLVNYIYDYSIGDRYSWKSKFTDVINDNIF